MSLRVVHNVGAQRKGRTRHFSGSWNPGVLAGHFVAKQEPEATKQSRGKTVAPVMTFPRPECTANNDILVNTCHSLVLALKY